MSFAIPFSKSFYPPISSAVTGTPWYLSGNISSSNCAAAYQPKGASSLASSYVNLANPGTYNAAPGVAPSWNATDGWICNGTQNLTTGLVPSNGWSGIARFVTDTSVLQRAPFGCANSAFTIRFYIAPRQTTTAVQYGYAATGYNVSPAIDSGTMGFTGDHGYRNGVQDVVISYTAGSNGLGLYLCADNYNGTVNLRWQGTIQAIAIYSVTLTSAQMLAVHTAMMAL